MITAPIQSKKWKKALLWSVVSIWVIAVILDIWNINNSETDNKKNLASITLELKNANNKIDNIESSLRKFGFKISGDSIVKINNTFVDNSSTNVKSENQKGGQTAGTINNY